MSDCYIVRRGGGGKNTFDFTDKDFLLSMTKNWLFAKGNGFTTNGYIIFPSAKVCGSYGSNTVGISVKFNYPTDFNVLTDVITTYTYSALTTGYWLNKPNKVKEGNFTYYSRIFDNECVYVSEDVQCAYPEIKKHFGKWHDYRDLRYIDVVKYPAQNKGNVFTDYIISKQVYNGNTWLTTLALKNPSKVCIDIFDTAPKAKLRIVAEYICNYTYSVSSYDPSIKLDTEYTNNPNRSWYFDDVDAVLNGVAFTTCDILYEDGTLAMKANCTLDEVIQKE